MLLCIHCGSRSSLPVNRGPSPSAVDSLLVSACVRLQSCSRSPFDTSVSRCIWNNQRDPQAIVTSLDRLTSQTCVNAAGGDCTQVETCATGWKDGCDGVPSRKKVCRESKVAYCAKDRLHLSACGEDASEWHLNPGSSCLVGADGNAECGFGLCTSPPQPCDGNTRVTCENGVIRRVSCGEQSCRASPSGPECVALGPPCQTSRCEGDIAIRCESGHELRGVCTSLTIPATCGSDCYASASCTRSPTCIPSPSLACDPLTHDDSCDGLNLIYCDGTERALDCTSLGFSACTVNAGRAACR